MNRVKKILGEKDNYKIVMHEVILILSFDDNSKLRQPALPESDGGKQNLFQPACDDESRLSETESLNSL